MTATQTKERPILFSGSMVRATLDGRKTQTRRVVTVPWGRRTRCQPFDPYYDDVDGKLYCADEYGDWHEAGEWLHRRYGSPGDTLWVRETWAPISPHEFDAPIEECRIEYRADTGSKYPGEWPDDAGDDPGCCKWRPSIHMPRWACRLRLLVKAVRVERLQAISLSDTLAEGVLGFSGTWDSINAKRDKGRWSWAKNPWVWVYEFERVR